MEIIRASETADFLALVPALVGRNPERSIVFVPFHGTRTFPTACRFDLPVRSRRSDMRAVVHAALGILSRIPDADRVDVVVYTDRSFEGERGIPHLELGRAAFEGLRRAGFGVGLAACVAADGWGDYRDRTHRDVGRPLAEIEESPIAARARGLGADDDLGPGIPDADPAARARVERLLGFEKSTPEDDGQADELVAMVRDIPTLDLYDLALDGGDDPAMIALALEVFDSPADRDAALLYFAFGREIGERTVASQARWEATCAESGLSMDEAVAAELASGERPEDVEAADLLMGLTDVVPDRDRLTSLIRRLRTLVAHAPREMHAAPLTMLGWALWACGSGSAAGKVLDRALTVAPGYGMARLVRTLVDSGVVPEWLYSRLDPAL